MIEQIIIGIAIIFAITFVNIMIIELCKKIPFGIRMFISVVLVYTIMGFGVWKIIELFR